jgi:hypothetical protein
MPNAPTPQRRPLYRGYRLHTARLPSGRWLCSLVRLGPQHQMTPDSLTPVVTRVPGEYASEAEALEAAQRYINEEKARRKEEPG